MTVFINKEIRLPTDRMTSLKDNQININTYKGFLSKINLSTITQLRSRQNIKVYLHNKMLKDKCERSSVILVTGCWIHVCIHNQYASQLKLWVRFPGMLMYSLQLSCDKDYQWLATCWKFYLILRYLSQLKWLLRYICCIVEGDV